MYLALAVEVKLQVGYIKKVENKPDLTSISRGLHHQFAPSFFLKGSQSNYSPGSVSPRMTSSSSQSVVSMGGSGSIPTTRPIGEIQRLRDKELQSKKKKWYAIDAMTNGRFDIVIKEGNSVWY